MIGEHYLVVCCHNALQIVSRRLRHPMDAQPSCEGRVSRSNCYLQISSGPSAAGAQRERLAQSVGGLAQVIACTAGDSDTRHRLLSMMADQDVVCEVLDVRVRNTVSRLERVGEGFVAVEMCLG